MEIALQVISLFGGLGMFLFGMHIMSTGLEKAAGDKMRRIMEKVTGNMVKSVILGLVVAALTQSSSATTVMVVGFVNAGLLTLRQSVGIIMGANIGTTVTAWLVSLNDIPGGTWYLDMLKPDTLAPIALIIGAVLLFISSDKHKTRTIVGEVIVGLGILFIGMNYMSSSMQIVFDEVPALQQLFSAGTNPFLGIVIGAGVTAVIQSSSASVGMLQAIASTGVLAFSTAFPIIMGQNIGTCVTALLSSIGTNKNARRAAMIHLYFNIIGTIFFMVVIYVIQFAIGFPFWNDSVSAVDISIFHSIFNITCTILLLPFSKVLVWLANITIRSHEEEDENPYALLDDRVLSTPPIAIANVRKAMSNMFAIAKQNVEYCRTMLRNQNADLIEQMHENEEQLDHYEIIVTQYLTKISDLPLSAGDMGKVTGYFHMVNNIERIGDYCDNISESIVKMDENNVKFSQAAEHGLTVLFNALDAVTDLAFEAFDQCDATLAKQIEPLEEVVDGLQETLEKEHMRRLKAKECSVEAGVLFLEIISNAERISDHCSNIGIAILQATSEHGETFDRHEYLRKLHADMSGVYRAQYDAYKKQFAL